MNLLLDTCTFLWLVDGSSRLSTRAAQLISGPDNLRWLSSVSIWEIAVSTGLGRRPLPTPLRQFVLDGCSRYDIALLVFSEDDAFLEPSLPRVHRDPFDRMLVCQAINHGLTILTPDLFIQRYPVATAW